MFHLLIHSWWPKFRAQYSKITDSAEVALPLHILSVPISILSTVCVKFPLGSQVSFKSMHVWELPILTELLVWMSLLKGVHKSRVYFCLVFSIGWMNQQNNQIGQCVYISPANSFSVCINCVCHSSIFYFIFIIIILYILSIYIIKPFFKLSICWLVPNNFCLYLYNDNKSSLHFACFPKIHQSSMNLKWSKIKYYTKQTFTSHFH